MTCAVASAGLSPKLKLQLVEYEWWYLAWRFEESCASIGWLDVFHEREEAFGERGMDVEGALQEWVGPIRQHESAEDLHEFSSFGCKDGSTEDTVVRSIDNQLHEPRRLAALDGARDIGHRASPDFYFETFGARFPFGHADAAELRIGEDTVRHEAIFSGQVLPFH